MTRQGTRGAVSVDVQCHMLDNKKGCNAPFLKKWSQDYKPGFVPSKRGRLSFV